MSRIVHCSLLVLLVLFASSADSAWGADATWNSAPAAADGRIVFRVVMVEDEDGDPVAAGRKAAEKLRAAMGDVALKAVVMSECFEDLEYKEEMLKGVYSVLPKQIVVGSATYGSFTQAGCTDFDAVCLMGIGGRGIGVSAALVTDMGVSKLTLEENEAEIKQRLHDAGTALVGKLRKTDRDKLLVLLADAHSPKNQFLVEGAQRVVGAKFPITGGSANKNAGQTYVYFNGEVHQDAAIALMLSGVFRVAMTGRKAMDNDQVISTAGDGAAHVLSSLAGKPSAVLAFNCAGRRGKLRDPEDELAAIKSKLGKDLPLFGCYCAGEIGPVDASEKSGDALSGGSGWHVMFTVIGQ